MKQDIVRYISFTPLFQGLPENQIQDLTDILVDRIYARQQLIFAEGDEGDGFYLVFSGRVKIFKLSPEGKEQILHILGPGEPFGEVPVFAGEHFPANAEAMDESRIFFFPRKAFVGLIAGNPSMALNMLAILAKRLRRFTRLIDDLSLKEIPGRLAAHLLYLSEKASGSKDLELTVTKGQLASLLGTIPETLSRILGRMAKQGLIESKGLRIRILDQEALEELAESDGHL